mmetsp:Transcript_77769/g.241650  ORF Transcript_77769/g.241650 Transcript_77769/m.241650 type:complete len:176 (-) Transcript_77769:108-635(-)
MGTWRAEEVSWPCAVDVLLSGAYRPSLPEQGAVAEKKRHAETVKLVLGLTGKVRRGAGSRALVAFGIVSHRRLEGGLHGKEEEEEEVPAEFLEQYRGQVMCKQGLTAKEEHARCRRTEKIYQKEGEIEPMKAQEVERKELDAAVGAAIEALGGVRKPGGASVEREVQFVLDNLAW